MQWPPHKPMLEQHAEAFKKNVTRTLWNLLLSALTVGIGSGKAACTIGMIAVTALMTIINKPPKIREFSLK